MEKPTATSDCSIRVIQILTGCQKVATAKNDISTHYPTLGHQTV